MDGKEGWSGTWESPVPDPYVLYKPWYTHEISTDALLI